MKKIGWGVLGTGRMADWFCEDFQSVADGRLVAVGSRDLVSARAFADRHQIPQAYGDYLGLLEHPDVDAVYVATPHSLHLDNVRQAIERGKAVLCEKPLTISSAECEVLIALAQTRGVYVMEAMWTYFLPAIETAKRWVEEGRIGKLLRIKAELGYPVAYGPRQREYDTNLAGGCLLEMGVYPIALARLFSGQAPLAARAFATRAPNGVEDDVAAVLSYGDARAELGASFRARLPNAAYIVGEDGYIVIPDAFRASCCHLHVLDARVQSFEAPRRERGYNHQVDAVCADLRAGRRESARVPLSLSLAFQRDLELIRAAI